MEQDKVYLIGVGMGNPETLTVAGQKAIDQCATLIGARRLLVPYQGDKDCHALVSSREIAQCIAGTTAFPVGVLLSGDVGFYSGATALAPLLEGYWVERIAGISSLVYFCAKVGCPWQDVKLVSAHGRAHNVVGEIRTHEKTFVLTGGNATVNELCRQMTQQGLGDLTVWVGEELSYPQEIIHQGRAREATEGKFASLSVMLVENPTPMDTATMGIDIPDRDFIRGSAPMTKQEVRTLAVAKLALNQSDVVWDIGAGTGSVGVTCARAVPKGMVYAVEKNPQALSLLRENIDRFATTNMVVVAGEAPQVLSDLPTPQKVFLGGTSGQLKEILSVIFEKNPTCRIVLTAVTLETLALATAEFGALGLRHVEITQVAVTKTKTVGGYHMMEGQNPVWILSGEGSP